jgi:hypothetical protein
MCRSVGGYGTVAPVAVAWTAAGLDVASSVGAAWDDSVYLDGLERERPSAVGARGGVAVAEHSHKPHLAPASILRASPWIVPFSEIHISPPSCLPQICSALLSRASALAERIG